MRDERGDLIRNAHLVGFFRRICRLLFHRIKPVFVFDGATPAIKRMTVIARRRCWGCAGGLQPRWVCLPGQDQARRVQEKHWPSHIALMLIMHGTSPSKCTPPPPSTARQREQQDARLRRTAEKLLLNQLKQHALAQVASQGGSDVLAQMAGTQKSRGKRPDPFQEVVAQGSDAAAGGRAAGAQPHAVPAQCVPEGPALGASAPLPGEVEQELEAHLDLDLDQLGGVEVRGLAD